jgi:acyl-CoA thioester hydrolase
VTTTEPYDLKDADFHLHWTKDVVRYADTDRQGHVNNAVFATFFESGRVAILYAPTAPLAPDGGSFVIAHLTLDFLAEIRWPSEVSIGTTVLAIGRSSVTLGQGLFVEERCVATAETVIVLTDLATRKSQPLPDQARAQLERFSHPG